MVRNKLLWTLLAVLLFLLAGWGMQWFFANFEQRTREVVEGMSPAAKRNPLLAAERFLSRINVLTESVSGRDRLLTPPAKPGMLLVYRLGVSLPAEREQALLAWVRQGGHLLITPQRAWDEEAKTSGNNLLDMLGVQLVLRDTGQDQSAEPDAADAEPSANGSDRPAPIRFEIPGIDEPMMVAFSERRVLFDSLGHADWKVETDEGGHLLQYALGQGKITVISDLQLFSNPSIGKHDHALLLALLVGDQQHAWLLYSSAMPALPILVWRQAPGLVISLLTLAGLLVWSLTLRSGPVRSMGQPVRRNLMEHLAAVGGYLWRTDQAAGTFRRSQAALEQAWRRRHPLLGTMQQAARCQWIARRVGLPAPTVEKALYGEYQGEQEFIQVTAIQQRLAAELRIQKEQTSNGEKGSG